MIHTPGPDERAVVALSRRLGAVLPAAAVRVLRAGATLLADTDVPAELAEQYGARSLTQTADPDPAVSGLLLTLDPTTGVAARWVADGAIVLRTPQPPGAALLDAVAVMDRLRSPGGCPWDAEQTHNSLMPYLIEETYELYQALEDGDVNGLREELGDVLLQVLFHARVAQEMTGEDFDIDVVATELVTKLIARHPHVFAGSEQVHTAADQEIRWEQLKRAEKSRESSVDGVALGQPALALVAKLVSRTARVGLPSDLLSEAHGGTSGALFALAGAAKLAGDDPEMAARTAARCFADKVRCAERAARSAGLDPAALTAAQWREHWPR
ncbi:MAG: MazG family protein [Pseudonocardiaceae bacterium]